MLANVIPLNPYTETAMHCRACGFKWKQKHHRGKEYIACPDCLESARVSEGTPWSVIEQMQREEDEYWMKR